MKEMYWLTRISELDVMFEILWTIAIIAIIVASVGWITLKIEKEDTKNIKRVWLIMLVLLIISVVGDILTPSRRDVMLIYGLGSTIDYINCNDNAKQLPNKAVDALTRYLDEIGAPREPSNERNEEQTQ